jgi:CheY-like chemotaxis protein/HPt (histidine-containing phosphotransfer) domain-containing protein
MSRDDEIVAALRPTFVREATALATQIEEAAAAGRRSDVRLLAHRLVGTAGTVREDDLVTASRKLEELAGERDADDGAVEARARSVASAVRAAVAAIDVTSAQAPSERAKAPDALPVVVAIEDNPANVELLKRIFADSEAVELVTAQSGVEGVRLARERSAALVLLDLNLPDVSSEWVLAALCDADGQPVTRIAVVSADSRPNGEAHVRRLGASDYLAKPFDIEQLRAFVHEACAPAPDPLV